MTLDWVGRLSGVVRRLEPSHGCFTSSLRASSPDHWTNSCITPCRKSPSRIFPCMYVALYPFFQFVTSPNTWTVMLTTSQEITVTNYTGEAREYLKKLITAMGATFTPSMTGKNTVLIAALYVPFPFLFPLSLLLAFFLLPLIFSSFLLFFPPYFRLLIHSTPQPLSGTKATKALSWSILVVNHTWLENCFVQWRNLTVGVEKYIVFPPGVILARSLGRGVWVWDGGSRKR